MIDTSNLSPEQQAFVASHPEFLKGLEAEIPQQVAQIEQHHLKIMKKRVKWRRKLDKDLEKADELMKLYDPVLRALQAKYSEKLPRIATDKDLICPICGDLDHQNKMNGKAWCMKCNVPLVEKDKAVKWLRERINAVTPKIPPELRGLPKEDV